MTLNRAVWPDSRRPDLAAAQSHLQLNLFGDVSFGAVLDRLEPAANGFTWVGHIPGEALSTVTIAAVGGDVAGSVITRRAVYSIRSVAGSVVEVSEVVQDLFPEEAPPATVAVPRASHRPNAFPADDPIPGSDSGAVIDVLVLYTPAVETSAGGSTAAAALINLGVSETNTSYANSQVTQRLRLVHMEKVPYVENNHLGTDLYNLTNHDGNTPISTPLGDLAAALRDTYRADLVVLVTAPAAATSCGMAWQMESVSGGFAPFGFSVVDEGCISPNGSFGHELGHNMGARHDWFVDDATTPHTYAHGYVNTADRWRTVMAYNNLCSAQSLTCTRLLYWSNPGVSHGGAPMGIPGGTRSDCTIGNVNDVSCDADDHRTLNDSAAIVANFRSSGDRSLADFTGDLQERHSLAARDARRRVAVADGRRRPNAPRRTCGQVADTNWEIRGLGDQTGDGKADLLWRHTTTGQLYLWPMDGHARLAETYVGHGRARRTTSSAPATSTVTGSRTSSGGTLTNGEVWIWLMDGATPLSQAYIDDGGPGVRDRGRRRSRRRWQEPTSSGATRPRARCGCG